MATNYEGQASTNYKEAFSLFDKRGNGRVTLDSLGDLLRACGQNPTLSEIRDLEKNVGSDCELQLPCFHVHFGVRIVCLLWSIEARQLTMQIRTRVMAFQDVTGRLLMECYFVQSTSRPSSAC
jgi:hypothetical protein